jgi:uncharacterized repeat protein (TIGR01451 family)
MNKILFAGILVIGFHSFGQKFQNSESANLEIRKLQSAVFEENKGQMKDQFSIPRPDVLFYGASEGMSYFIRNTGLSYQLNRVERWKEKLDNSLLVDKKTDDLKQIPDQIGTYRVDAEWLNSNPIFEVVKGRELEGYNNYYNISEDNRPVLNVKKYESLILKDIWSGIDLHYYGNNGFLETDYIVAPGADYHKIKIFIKGAELKVNGQGILIMKTPFGEIHEGELKVFQNGQQIKAYWKIDDSNTVSFDIPDYNRELAMTIDPLTRAWGTYYGGTDFDEGNSTAIDSSGNIYLAGSTLSLNIISSGGHQNVLGGIQDAFLVKFSSIGTRVWGTYYGGSGSDDGNSIAIDNLGNVFLAGATESVDAIANGGHQNTYGGGFGGSDAFLVKFNSNGVRLWGTYYGGGGTDRGLSVNVNLIGDVFLAGDASSNTNISTVGTHQSTIGGGTYDAYLVKFNSNGVRQWGTYYGGSGSDAGLSSCIDQNGNLYLAGLTTTTSGSAIASGGHQNIFGGGTSDAFIVKFDNNGLRQWGSYYGGSGNEFGRATYFDLLGNVYLAGSTESTTGISSSGSHQSTFGSSVNTWSDGFLVKFNNNGTRQWGTYYGGNQVDGINSVFCDLNNDVYIFGATGSINNISTFGAYQALLEGGSKDLFLSKFNQNGIQQWGTYLGSAGTDNASSIFVSESGKIVLTGNTNSNTGISNANAHQPLYGGGTKDAFLMKFNQPRINGFIWQDLNSNCNRESNEMAIVNGVNLIIQPGNYVAQSFNSIWSVDSLPAGNYTITIDTTNLNWTSTCPITQSFTVTNPNGFTDGPNFGLISTNPCSDPDVSIYAPFLRRCFSNQNIYISACNQIAATGSLDSSYVDVELDQLLTVNSSTLPYSAVGNSVYRFQTGNIVQGQCVNFSISTTVSCLAVNNSTLCIEATLHPIESCVLDTIPTDPIIIGSGTQNGGTLDGLPQPCTLPWDQSSLSVDGWCQGDSVYFSITNTGEPGGGDMECYSPMWVTIDGVVTYTDSIMIPGGQTLTLSFPGDGQTWILNAEQHPLHPGNSHPNAHVEACGDTTNWTPDIVNDFPQDDADPVVDIYCGVVTGSYDPNDKTGYPNGVTDQYYIQPNQQLQYVIRFQNTGTDTAFTVVIRDTLETDLNIFTVTPGVSSHNYQFRMYGPRVLEWTFENIMLPDSTTNQEASNGFVTFHVDQVPNLAPGTEINNDADIYFDYNDPITTNTTIHRIYEGFVSVLNIEELIQEGKSLFVYPNPTSNNITIKGKESMNHNFRIFDQMGREILSGKLNGISTEVNLSMLSKGIYTIKIEGNYKVAKIVKE